MPALAAIPTARERREPGEAFLDPQRTAHKARGERVLELAALVFTGEPVDPCVGGLRLVRDVVFLFAAATVALSVALVRRRF